MLACAGIAVLRDLAGSDGEPVGEGCARRTRRHPVAAQHADLVLNVRAAADPLNSSARQAPTLWWLLISRSDRGDAHAPITSG